MKTVAIITGGAGGMGLACAKLVGKHHQLVLCDLSQQKLEVAAAELGELGIHCETAVCDITDKNSVQSVFNQAITLGQLSCVIHTAGVSPQMADAKTILKVNSFGTINITEVALDQAQPGFALINVASMAGHFLPSIIIPKRAYAYAFKDSQKFLAKALFPCLLMPTKFYRSGIAYAISKNFVIWYSKKMAEKFGKKQARILSVSPGSFDTEMGRLEEKSGSAELLKHAALKRFGKPEEIAEILAFCASEKASYLTGTDILCDGGVIGSRA